MTSDIATRVAKGVALLDEQLPGWAGQIDLIKLDIKSTESCVVGQLFPENGFNWGLDELDVEWGFEYGFDCNAEDRIDEQQFDFIELTQEWKRVIEILRQRQDTEVEVPETVAV